VTGAWFRNASFALFVACLGLAMLVYAHAAPAKSHAPGSSTSSGFAVIGAHFDLATSDLTKVNSMWFNLTPPPARRVELRLTVSPGTWYSCTRRLSRFVCELPVPIALEAVTRFDVRVARS
jgi:hypothetical protein